MTDGVALATFISSRSGGYKCEVKMLAQLVSSEASALGL